MSCTPYINELKQQLATGNSVQHVVYLGNRHFNFICQVCLTPDATISSVPRPNRPLTLYMIDIGRFCFSTGFTL